VEKKSYELSMYVTYICTYSISQELTLNKHTTSVHLCIIYIFYCFHICVISYS